MSPAENPAYRSGLDLVDRLRAPRRLFAVELRPPRRGSRGNELERWIDLYHAVRRLTADDCLVLTTDSAVGEREEESLRHLQANLGPDADLSRVLPFLTVKHPLDYCLRFPERALAAGHRGLVVLGGDQADGVPRCVAHAAELRRELRRRLPGLALGGWANPHRDPDWQVELLARDADHTDFHLTQVVSHHDLARLERFLAARERAALKTPLLVGVFFYRSGRAGTLAALEQLLPVPAAALQREFLVEGLSAVEVCRRTLDALGSLGLDRIYLCNLPPPQAPALLARLREPAGAACNHRRERI
jgi:hypothetical protein